MDMSWMRRQADTVQDQRIQPCHHMETLVSCLCDGALSGLPRWYTRFHILHCSKCRKALKALVALRDRLSRMGDKASSIGVSALTSERRSALEQAMDEIDRHDR